MTALTRLTLAVGLGAGLACPASAAPVRVDAVEVELVAREASAVAGRATVLGLRIRHDPHWHTYWRNPGDSGLPTRVDLKLPAGFVAGPIDWPFPKRLLVASLASYAYEGELVLPFSLEVPAAAAGSTVTLNATASWLMCREVCIPGEASLSLQLPVIAAGELAPSRHASLFERARAQRPLARLDVPVSVSAAGLSIGLPLRVEAAREMPAIGVESAEFFPYREVGVRHAAVQRLIAGEPAGPWARRLEIELSDEGRAQWSGKLASGPALAEGVVVIAGRAFELVPREAQAPAPGGRELARSEALPVDLPKPGASRLGLAAGSVSGPASGLPGALGLGAGSRAPASSSAAAAGSGSVGLGLSLLFAFLGGLILNLMPCVFPVVGLKVLAFAGHAHGADTAIGSVLSGASAASRVSARGARLSAIAFAAGVLGTFWLLAALLLGLRAAGVSAGWGFQLQSPEFVVLMALLFVAIGLNLSGVFEFGLGLTRLARLDRAGGLESGGLGRALATAGSGALAVVVATPCTAPFMASALGFTLTSSAPEALAVFTLLGLGMALPYLLLGWFPGWLAWLPRPGRWMESLRQFFAFPMYATAAWLAWVLGQQAGGDAVLALTMGAVLLALAAWLYGRFVQQRMSKQLQLVRLAALALALSGIALAVSSAEPASAPQAPASAPPGAQANPDAPALWEPWSAARVAEATARGQSVFVDFTAAWCVTCQVNKKLVLDREPVLGEMTRRGVLRLRADWTQRDAAISQELARFGRNGVPLYLAYTGSGASPRVLPELLTSAMVIDALAGASIKR